MDGLFITRNGTNGVSIQGVDTLGRERLYEDEQVYVERALGIVQDVVKRGAFKTRTPEGKARDH